MKQPRFITNDEILNKLSLATAIEVTKQAFIDYEKGLNQMPEKMYLDLPEYDGDFRAMPAYVKAYDIAGIKWVNSHKNNYHYKLPSVMATLLLSNPKTGELIAVMDATAITSIRTGAVGAIATQLFHQKPTLSVAFIGSGRQAEFQLKCIQQIKEINELKIYDKNQDQAQKFMQFAQHMADKVMISQSITEACIEADVIITTTPGKQPVVHDADLPKNCLIIAIGADAVGKQELDHSILKTATLIVDDRAQAIHSGELNTGISKGIITNDDIYASIGEMLLEKKPLISNKRILVDSTGLAIQDIALAGYFLKA